MRLRLKRKSFQLMLNIVHEFTRSKNADESSTVYIRYVHGNGGTALSIISRYYDHSSAIKFYFVFVAGKQIDGIWYRVAT